MIVCGFREPIIRKVDFGNVASLLPVVEFGMPYEIVTVIDH